MLFAAPRESHALTMAGRQPACALAVCLALMAGCASSTGWVEVEVDIATGRRELWTTLVPPDASGVYAISEFQIAPAELAYFYSYKSRLSELYLVRGPS